MGTAAADLVRGGPAVDAAGGSVAGSAGGSLADCASGVSAVNTAGGLPAGSVGGPGAARPSPAGDPREEWPDCRRSVPDDPTAETVGQRLRGKYERAVRLAGAQLGRGRSGRQDRGKLIRMLVEERFMVPQEASRRSLHGIARETRSSYGRVAQCHQHLVRLVGSLLRADPEFDELVRRARSAAEGVELVIDEGLEGHLARVSASELAERLPSLGPARRAQVVDALMSASGENLTPWVREVVSRLSADARECVMRVVAASEVQMGADSPKRLRSDPGHRVEVGRTPKGTAVGSGW